jgi:PAS domain S-box-containing protein
LVAEAKIFLLEVVIDADIGRSIAEFKFGFELHDLEQWLTDAIHTLTWNECDVQGSKGSMIFALNPSLPDYRKQDRQGHGSFVDIEAQKRAQGEIQVGEEKYRLLIEGATGIAVILLDTKGIVTDWIIGAERVLGYSSTQIVGQRFAQLFEAVEADYRLAAEDLARAGAGVGGINERWLMRRDGTRFGASLIITALQHEEGAFRGFSMVVRDVSEKCHVEELRQEEVREKTNAWPHSHTSSAVFWRLWPTLSKLAPAKETIPRRSLADLRGWGDR